MIDYVVIRRPRVTYVLISIKVAPAELEGVLLSHPGVLDAAVIGVADAEAGEFPKGFVVLKDDSLSIEEIHRYVESKLLEGHVHHYFGTKIDVTWCKPFCKSNYTLFYGDKCMFIHFSLFFLLYIIIYIYIPKSYKLKPISSSSNGLSIVQE